MRKEKNNKKRMKRKMFWIAAALLFCFVVFFSNVKSAEAVGIAPAYKEVIYNNQDITYTMKVVNENGEAGTYSVEIAGDLSQYVKADRSSVTFAKGEIQKDVNIKLSIPSGMKMTPGEYTTRIIVKEPTQNQGEIMALVGISSKLITTIPGEGAYVQAKLFAPNFVDNVTNSFSVEITNKGIKEARNCVTIIDVTSSLNAKVTSLISESMTVPGASVQTARLSWMPHLNSGLYTAKASVVCEGTTAGDEKLFSVGSPDVNVISFTTSSFKLGSISKFDLILSSDWGEAISNVYANIEVNKNDKVLFTSQTESTDLVPNGKAVLPVYLDTTGFSPGEYNVYLTLHYLEKQKEQVYTALMSNDKIVMNSLSGNVVGNAGSSGGSDDGGGMNSLLIIAIIVIAVVNIILVVRVLRKKKKE
jgi:hypothetical protein